MTDPAQHIATSTDFVHLLFDGIGDGWVHLFARDHDTGDRRTFWKHATDVALLPVAASTVPNSDVWFGPATRNRDLGNKRGGSEDCVAIMAVWADIDVAGPNHAAPDLPPSLAAAYELVRSFPLPPSVIIETGGGLQPWWPLTDPVPRLEAGPFLTRWGATWHELGRRHGWHVDNVFDMARVMRLPGTRNHKTGRPQPVTITVWEPDRRYTIDDLDQYTIDTPPPPQHTPPRRVPYIGPERPGDAFNASMDPGLLVERLGGIYDHESAGDRYYRAPHHERRGETGIVAYADAHVTVYSETFAATNHLQVRRPYDAFGLYTHAYHGGDWRVASDQLAAMGYGTKNTPPPWDIPGPDPDRPVVDLDDDPEDDWARIDLVVPAGRFRTGEYTPIVPTVLSVEGGLPLFYPGRINSLFGESGGGKSWLALWSMGEAVLNGQRALMVDWEDNPNGIAERLVYLGLDDEQIDRVDYRNPTTSIGTGITSLRRDALAEYAVIVIDSTGEAMAAGNVDSNADQEVARWFAAVKHLTRFPGGPCVIVVDHVPKDKEAPSSYAIGSQRKRAAITGASYRVDTVREPAKGKDGKLKLTVAKDRPGNRPKGSVAAMADISSSDGDVNIRLHVPDNQPDPDKGGVFRPTVYMERVSRWVELNPGATQNAILTGLGGKQHYVNAARDVLIAEGWMTKTSGPRGALLHHVVRPFREGEEWVIVDDPEPETNREEQPGNDLGPPRPTSARPRPDLGPGFGPKADDLGPGTDRVPSGPFPGAEVGRGDTITAESPSTSAQPKMPW